MFKNKIEKNIKDLLAIISSSEFNTYLVGGCLRDLILGYTPKDLDILVEDEIDEFSKFLSKSLNSKIIKFQNHGFEIVKESLPKNVEVTHKSLFDNCIEGIKLKNKPVFSVQYHPESNPGPQDSVYLFQEFINNIKKNAKKKRY